VARDGTWSLGDRTRQIKKAIKNRFSRHLMENTPWYHGIYGDLMGFYSDLMGYLWDIPSGNLDSFGIISGEKLYILNEKLSNVHHLCII
jgi:hypothetical protein